MHGQYSHASGLKIIASLGKEFERVSAAEATSAARTGATARLAFAAAVFAILAAGTAAGAVTGVFEIGSEIPGDESRGPGQPASGVDETVLATGSTPVAGRWQITSHKSQEVIQGGDVAQPAGLECLRLVLLDRHDRTLIGGSGWCGDVRGDFAVSNVPATDGNGRVEVLLWGRAPEDSGGVELTASNGQTRRATLYEGPEDFAGDLWVMGAPHTLKDARLRLMDESGAIRGSAIDASDDLARGYDVEETVHTPGGQ